MQNFILGLNEALNEEVPLLACSWLTAPQPNMSVLNSGLIN